jgi:hydroxyacylglutathione hydrolase
MQPSSLTVTAIPAFSDNYIWLLRTGGLVCAVVDPGDGREVIDRLEKDGFELDTILITHHHPDHIGGVPTLLRRWPEARVIGPEDQRISPPHRVVREGDVVSLKALGLDFEVVEVPGHTSTHIAYHGHGVLFPGDTLFSVGCGRLFEGTPEQMQVSLDKLAELPGDTEVYCAHEYTRANCRFALAVEPENGDLREFCSWVDGQRRQGHPTLPSTIELERACNPFMRTREAAVIASARKIDAEATAGASTMAVIRAWKDRFQG